MNPCLLNSQGHNCLHSVVQLGKYLALLYVVCQPEIAIDEPDSLGYMHNTPLHCAVYQHNRASTHILLKLGMNLNVADHDCLTQLHCAAFTRSKECIKGLLKAGADIQAKDKNLCTAEIVLDFRNHDIWNIVVEELVIKANGSRVCRLLSEVYRIYMFHLSSRYSSTTLSVYCLALGARKGRADMLLHTFNFPSSANLPFNVSLTCKTPSSGAS